MSTVTTAVALAAATAAVLPAPAKADGFSCTASAVRATVLGPGARTGPRRIGRRV